MSLNGNLVIPKTKVPKAILDKISFSYVRLTMKTPYVNYQPTTRFLQSFKLNSTILSV